MRDGCIVILGCCTRGTANSSTSRSKTERTLFLALLLLGTLSATSFSAAQVVATDSTFPALPSGSFGQMMVGNPFLLITSGTSGSNASHRLTWSGLACLFGGSRESSLEGKVTNTSKEKSGDQVSDETVGM